MRGDHKNYYQILGLTWNASPEDIRAAYRTYAAKFHPDKHEGDPFFEERFKEVTEAYEVLGDSEKRRRYDVRVLGKRKVQAADYETVRPSGTKRGRWRMFFEIRRLDLYLASFYWINLFAWSIIQRMNDNAEPGGYAWGLFLSSLSAWLVWFFIAGVISRAKGRRTAPDYLWIGSLVAGLGFAVIILWTTWLP